MPIDRTIVHFDLDTFFVSVERLKDSSLIGKPVIVGGGSDRGVVASCSYECRKFGVHAAMPGRLAKQLCPDAIFIRGDMDQYSKYSNLVTEIIEAKAPVVEKASIDEHYLDISGMDKFFGSALWTKELRESIIKETGLPISYGLSINKTVAKVATGTAKPNGAKVVDYGLEKGFLSPLPIHKIPGIGEKTSNTLRNMGVQRIGTVQEMPIELLQRTFGENGTGIWRKCNAIDFTPVEPYREQKSMSAEETFHQDTTDMSILRNTLIMMVDKLCFELRSQRRVTGCVTLKIRYTDFETHTFQSRIAYTASDHILIEKALELFQKNYSRRILIRLIGIKFSHLVSGFNQISLFDDTAHTIGLYQAMDKMRRRFGVDAVMRCIGIS